MKKNKVLIGGIATKRNERELRLFYPVKWSKYPDKQNTAFPTETENKNYDQGPTLEQL